MKRFPIVLAAALATFGASLSSHAAVILTASTTTPNTGVGDQFNLGTDAVIPGGSYNQQAFSDNSGPPGQTFTTAAGSSFTLDAFSFKGALAGSSNTGNFTAGTTWGLRLSSVSGTTLTSLLTVTGIATPGTLVGDDWLTWTFSAADKKILLPATTYAVEVFSSEGYYGFDAATDPNAYTGGTAINSTSTARTFSATTLQDRGYDRTFVADVSAVPEPGSAFLLLGGISLLAQRRRR